MDIKDLKEKIEKNLADIQLKVVRESLLIEDAKDLPKVVSFLKEDEELKLDYVSSITAADYINHLECVYHLYSMGKKGPLVTLRARCHDRDHASLPSITPIYRGAEFQEREAYDLYGIVFEGHPDLRRILMWDGFEGFPMRKDYVQENSEILEHDDVEWLKKNGVKVSDSIKHKADELKREGKRAIAEPPTDGHR